MAASHKPSVTGLQQLSEYDYVRFLSRSRVAWEYLRRHPAYRRDWRSAESARPHPVHL